MRKAERPGILDGAIVAIGNAAPRAWRSFSDGGDLRKERTGFLAGTVPLQEFAG